MSAYGLTNSSLKYLGKRSDGEKLVNISANINSAKSHLLRFQGTNLYHIATPQNAIMYVEDSPPVLNITVHIKTDANIAILKGRYLYCFTLKYGKKNSNTEGINTHRSE